MSRGVSNDRARDHWTGSLTTRRSIGGGLGRRWLLSRLVRMAWGCLLRRLHEPRVCVDLVGGGSDRGGARRRGRGMVERWRLRLSKMISYSRPRTSAPLRKVHEVPEPGARRSARRRAARRPCCSACRGVTLDSRTTARRPAIPKLRPAAAMFLDPRQEHLLREISREKMAPGLDLRAAAFCYITEAQIYSGHRRKVLRRTHMSAIDMPGLGRAVSLGYDHGTAQYPYFIP